MTKGQGTSNRGYVEAMVRDLDTDGVLAQVVAHAHVAGARKPTPTVLYQIVGLEPPLVFSKVPEKARVIDGSQEGVLRTTADL